MTTDRAEQSPAATPDWAYGVGRLVVLSGAGLSTDSGIPDFRGPSGAWTRNPDLQRRRTYQAFLADPELRASYWRSRYEHPVWHAEPNAGHSAIASLPHSDIDTTVVTQNVDGLHQRAGTAADRVIELHGTMHQTICVRCGQQSATADILARIKAGEATPHCHQCDGILKTATVMFGQTIPPEVFTRAEQAVTSCDLILAVGTSLAVEPAASLCGTAVGAGARLVIVNRDATPYDSIATEIIRDPLSEALPRIVGQLRGAAGTPASRPVPARPERDVQSPPVPRPSQLLRSQARTSRLRSRSEELERLTAWCAGSGMRSHLVWGPAGVGKSRLAMELADRLIATGLWDVEFLAPDARPPDTERPLLVVVDDAETCREHPARTLRIASACSRPVRVLLLARSHAGWCDEPPSGTDTCEELTPPDRTRSEHADAVRTAVYDYAAALTARGVTCAIPDRALLMALSDAPAIPGELQASVLARLLGLTGTVESTLVACELAHLKRASDDLELALSAAAAAEAAVTAILCGAADEDAAVASLGHIPALRDAPRARTAKWLREVYPPTAPGHSPYWNDSLPDPVTEDVVATLVTAEFLVRMLADTTETQDRRVLMIMARAAATRPVLRERLTELLSVMPGLSPAAVDVALGCGHPEPLADALCSLASSNDLPAELLDTIPAGCTVLGEFPVLLAASLVEAYERRVETHPESGRRGLTHMLIELAERLADLGRAESALAAAQRSLENAERLTDPLDYPARAAESVRRATALGHDERGASPDGRHSSASAVRR